jgi:hypothetical protein
MELYYVANKYLYLKHLEIINTLKTTSPKIYLNIGSDSYEYPIWVLLRNKYASNFKVICADQKMHVFQKNAYFNQFDYLIFEDENQIHLISPNSNKYILSL